MVEEPAVIFQEPQRTPYDVNFQLFGVPVRVHPFFWLVAVLLGTGVTNLSEGVDPKGLLLWVVVLFVSILVHEFGHAFAIRYYGWDPHVILYGMGGLASYNPGYTPSMASYRRKGNSTVAQIVISAAGPAAGLALAGIVVLALVAGNRSVSFFSMTVGRGPRLDWMTEPQLFWLVQDMLWVNVFWSLVNLLPVFPLDGGKIAREMFVAANPQDGHRLSLMLSIATGIGLAVIGFTQFRSIYMALMFGYLAYASYQTLQAMMGGGFGRRGPW